MFWRSRKMLVSIIVILGLSFFTPTGEVHFFWEKLPVFNSLFGFIGCIALILVAKALGKLFVQKDEHYYE